MGVSKLKQKLPVSEHGEQSAFFDYVRIKRINDWRYELVFSVPNGAKLPWSKNKKGERYCPQAKWLKDEGLLPGVPDVVCAYLNPGALFLEFKVGNNQPTTEQNRMLYLLQCAGHTVRVVRSSAEAIKELERHLGTIGKALTKKGSDKNTGARAVLVESSSRKTANAGESRPDKKGTPITRADNKVV